jgi:hypothetical protein
MKISTIPEGHVQITELAIGGFSLRTAVNGMAIIVIMNNAG